MTATPNGNRRLWQNEELERILDRVFYLIAHVQHGGTREAKPNQNVRPPIEQLLRTARDTIIDDITAKLKKLMLTNVALQEQNNELRDAMQTAKDQKKELITKKELLNVRLRRLRVELKRIANEYFTTENERLKAYLIDLRVDTDAAKEDARNITAQVAHKERELIRLQDTNAQLQRELRDTERDLQSWETETESETHSEETTESDTTDPNAHSNHSNTNSNSHSNSNQSQSPHQNRHALKIKNMRAEILELRQTQSDLEVELQDILRKAMGQRDTHEHALSTLERSHTAVLHHREFRNLSPIPELTAQEVEQLQAFYRTLLRERDARREREKQQVMVEWERNYSLLKEANTESQTRADSAEKHVNTLHEQIAKYRVLWNHFFGVDAPLKENIGRVNDTLNKLEEELNVSPLTSALSAPLKITDLSCGNRSPLKIGRISHSNRVFELYNNTARNIVLDHCFLKNRHGHTHAIPATLLEAGNVFLCSVGKLSASQLRRDCTDGLSAAAIDIQLPAKFCAFDLHTRLYLSDSRTTDCILFPNKVENVEELDGNNREYLKLINTETTATDTDPWILLTFQNCSGKAIRFLQCKFVILSQSQSTVAGTFVAVPEVILAINATLRVIIGREKLSPNDVLLSGVTPVTGMTLHMKDRKGTDFELHSF